MDLRVAAAPDIAPLLSELAGDYLATREQAHVRCMRIAVDSAESAEVARRLSRDQALDSMPHVWVPDSSVWVRYVEASDAGDQRVGDDAPSVARSPTIGGMLQPMAEALGWPGRQLGWSEVLPLIQDRKVWADRGHPEWGPFQMGFTDPAQSTVGLHSILSLGAAQDGVWIDELSSEGITAPEVRLPLLSIERGIARRHATVRQQLTGLRAADDRGEVLSVISALPISERDLWRYNRGLIQAQGTDGSPTVPMVGIYPREGGLYFDYPYVETVEATADEATGILAADFGEYLLRDVAQRQFREHGFRDHDNIPGDVLSANPGVQPERAGGMAPPPSGTLVRAALDAWTTVARRTTTLLAIDVSGSMAQPAPDGDATRLQRTVEAAAGAIELAAPDSTVGLWEFSTDLTGGADDGDHRELVPLGPVDEQTGGTPRRTMLVQRLQQLRPTHDTALYDTILAAVRAIREAHDTDRLNDVVVLTDGRSDGDDLTLYELLARLRDEQDPNRPVRVVAIAYGEDVDLEPLRRIADATGGELLTPRSEADMPAVFLQVLTGS